MVIEEIGCKNPSVAQNKEAPGANEKKAPPFKKQSVQGRKRNPAGPQAKAPVPGREGNRNTLRTEDMRVKSTGETTEWPKSPA